MTTASTHTTPLTTAATPEEVRVMAGRVASFQRRGLGEDAAGRMADKLLQRDRDESGAVGTGPRSCLECDHIGQAGGGRYRCGNWRALGITRHEALLPGLFVIELHQCKGFAPDGQGK